MLAILVQPTNSIFTTFLKPIKEHTRYHGVRLVIFVDDILIIGHNHQEYLQHVSFLKNLLTDFDFIVNTEKSHLEPSSVSDLSRFHRQFSQNAIRILPEYKVLKLKNAYLSIFKQKVVSLSDVAHVTGPLASTSINHLELLTAFTHFSHLFCSISLQHTSD